MSLPVYETTEKTRTRMFPTVRELFIEPLVFPWRSRELIWVILRRELAIRFSASVVGRAWAVVGPLVMLAIYMATFSATFGQQSGAAFKSPGALSVFSGLVIFNIFMELIGRAPLLIHEHLPFIKRSIFPSVILGWIAVLRAFVYGGVAWVLLVLAQLVTTQSLPVTILLTPFVILPMTLFLVGLTLGLAALGAFTRDLAHLIFSFAPILMFITPVFYTVNMVPSHLQFVSYLNPITPFVEMIRDITVFGILPSPELYAVTVVGSVIMFVLGNAVFMRYKDVLVDVI